MKLSDAIANRIKKETDIVFGITGACVMNLLDSFHKKGIRIISMHHEQSAAIAADAYARFKGFGCCIGTSGPGVTNLITGTACSYFDSIPVLTIGGQVPKKNVNYGRDRQFGFQEVDGVSLMEPITKFSRRMDSLEDLEYAIYTIKEGRQGPTFLEICDDLQRTEVDKFPKELIYEPKEIDEKVMEKFNKLLFKAKRPIIIVGRHGWKVISNIPMFRTWGTQSNLPDFGITGNPQSNEFMKKADLVIMIGTRMDTHQCPHWELFKNAKKIAIGLEFPHKVDLKIDTDLRDKPFVINLFTIYKWVEEYNKIKHFDNPEPPYIFIKELNELSDENDIIIPDMGQTGCIALQTWILKGQQRMFNGMNHSPMGYALPGSIGASLATNRRVIVIVGDGSFMVNVHDLQTIKDLNLDVKIFVVNNGGYGMARQTQNDWKEFLDQRVASDFEIPNIKKLAKAFGIRYVRNYKKAFKYKGPTLSEIKFEDTTISPKWKWQKEH